MGRKRSLTMLLAALVVAGMASTAWALDQVSGLGQTAESAALGFVVKADRTGELNYESDAGDFSVHCKRFSSFELGASTHGYPKVEITARKCFRRNGAQRFLRAVFIDRGEPGITWDIARLWWSRSWPVTPSSATRADLGRVTAGNIQVLAG